MPLAVTKWITSTSAYSSPDWGQWWFLTKMNCCKSGSIYSVLTWRQFRVEMHQAVVVHGHYTRYKWNSAIHVWDITKIHKRYNKSTLFWHRAKVYFMCIIPLLWLMAVPIRNKSNPFFSDISQQTHKCYEEITIITQTWHRCYFIHASATYGTWLL